MTGLMRTPGGTAASIRAPRLGLGGTPSLAFQPAVDLATGRLLGFEALLRCHDAAGGNIPPDVLIPWAEAHGHMNELNEWVLSEACVQASRWPSDLQLAVNCSVFQLRRGTAAVAAATAPRTLRAQSRPTDRGSDRGVRGGRRSRRGSAGDDPAGYPAHCR